MNKLKKLLLAGFAVTALAACGSNNETLPPPTDNPDNEQTLPGMESEPMDESMEEGTDEVE